MRGYERLLAFSIDRHKTSIAFGFASLVAIVAIYGKFGKGVEFFPAIESTRAQITVKTPRGTSLATTDAVTRRAEEAAKCCENVDYVIADVGAGGARLLRRRGLGALGRRAGLGLLPRVGEAPGAGLAHAGAHPRRGRQGRSSAPR